MAKPSNVETSKNAKEAPAKNANSKGRGRQRRSRNFDPRQEKTIKDMNLPNQFESDNDWKWYASSESLLRDTASFSYLYPLGELIDKGQSAGTEANAWSIPGVMAIYTAPSLGYTNTPSDPATIAARNLYTAVRARNSGATNTYEAPDLMMYILAMDGIFSLCANIRRAYGVIQQYGKVNRYYAAALVYAMGFDYEDLVRHLCDFRAMINAYQHKMNSYVIPSSLPYLARHYWMYSNLYYDTPNNPKAQIMMYVPEGIWMYSRDTDQATALKPIPWMMDNYKSSVVEPRNSDSRPGWKVSEIEQLLEQLADPICADQIVNVMCGDMLKYFGAANCLTISDIDANYTIQPVYSQEVLSQMQNATLLGRWIDPMTAILDTPASPTGQTVPFDNNTVGQDKSIDGGWIMSATTTHIIDLSAESDGGENEFSHSINQAYRANKVVTQQHGEVTPADTMVATRLTNIVTGFEFDDRDQYNALTTQDFLDSEVFHAGGQTIYGYECHALGSDSANSVELMSYKSTIPTAGSDIATYAKVFYFAYPNRGQIQRTSLISSEDIYYTVPQFRKIRVEEGVTDAVALGLQMDEILTKNDDDFRRMAFVTNFTLHPPITYFTWTKTSLKTSGGTWQIAYNSSNYQLDFEDVAYYTLLDQKDLRMLARAALLSELAIAASGNSVI